MTLPPMNQNVTLAEIAEIAGVSPATVSRVLNGDERVAEHRVESVNRAVRELGYTPSRAARSLATGKTGLIATIIDSNLEVFTDPFWGIVTTAISRTLQQSNLQALLMATPLNKADNMLASSLSSQQVDGAIFFQLHDDSFVAELYKQGLPCVVVGTPKNATSIPFVDVDNAAGARMATEHLITRGAKNIATITGDMSLSAGKLRYEGYESAINGLGRAVDTRLVAHGNFSHESGIEAMEELLDSGVPFDAVFVANDLMALGAMSVLHDHEIKIPEQVAVIGFDDMFAAQLGRQKLSTIRQDIEGLGSTAASMMAEMVEGRRPASRMLQTELVQRETT